MWVLFVHLSLFYILATSKIISVPVPTCSSAPSRQLYSAARLGDQATSTMTWYPNPVPLSWHWANQSMPYPNNAECLASCDSTRIRTTDLPKGELVPVMWEFQCTGLLVVGSPWCVFATNCVYLISLIILTTEWICRCAMPLPPARGQRLVTSGHPQRTPVT